MVVLLEVERVNELVALIALGPEIIGKTLAAFATSQWWFFENTHDVSGERIEGERGRDNGGLWLSVRLSRW